jgi:hypothetical protein
MDSSRWTATNVDLLQDALDLLDIITCDGRLHMPFERSIFNPLPLASLGGQSMARHAGKKDWKATRDGRSARHTMRG